MLQDLFCILVTDESIGSCRTSVRCFPNGGVWRISARHQPRLPEDAARETPRYSHRGQCSTFPSRLEFLARTSSR